MRLWRIDYSAGSDSVPMNRTAPVSSSRIEKKKGLSAMKKNLSRLTLVIAIPTEVTAAASVPRSLTSTTALCLTWLMYT